MVPVRCRADGCLCEPDPASNRGRQTSQEHPVHPGVRSELGCI
jgi:hypothetical protein